MKITTEIACAFNMSRTWINTLVSSWFIAYHEVTQGPFSTPSGNRLACLGLAEKTTAHSLPRSAHSARCRRLGERKRAGSLRLHVESLGTAKGQWVLTSDTAECSASTFLSISHLPDVGGKWGEEERLAGPPPRRKKPLFEQRFLIESLHCLWFGSWFTLY